MKFYFRIKCFPKIWICLSLHGAVVEEKLLNKQQTNKYEKKLI